jgi:hypothetical protein
MKRKTILALALVAGLLGFSKNSEAQTILLQDDFTGNSLDTSLWTEFDTYVWGPSSVSVNNGLATFSYRPIIATTQTFTGGIDIAGSFSLGTLAQPENFQVVTRADGNVFGRWDEPAGLKFTFNTSGVSIAFADDSGNYTSFGVSTGHTLNNNQMYSFSVIDEGSQASVDIDGTEVVSCAVDPALGEDQGYVDFANRERSAGTELGPVTISTVPEPSTWALLAVALGSLVTFRRRS